MKIREFVIDFVNTFLSFLLSTLVFISHLVYQIAISISLFFKNIIIPAITELLADFNLFLHIIMQGVYSMLSSFSLLLSKLFLNMSRYYHQKSEQIITKTWDLN